MEMGLGGLHAFLNVSQWQDNASSTFSASIYSFSQNGPVKD